MTSKIKVDNINKVSDDSNIIKKCGTTTTIGSGASNPIVVDGSAITLGRCGGTVALASGATQTGFGRTGTVDWQTTIKTGDFTAANGEGYFVNTTSGQITVTLPASPSAGDIVAIKDYANTFDSNSVVLNRNGSNIDGTAENAQLVTEGLAVTLVYADATKGWLSTDSASKSDVVFPEFITATGGTITTVCTNYKVHTFTGPGTFTVCSVGNASGSNSVDYLVVAGGGSGGQNYAGGGGAGGYRESAGCGYTSSPLGACVSAVPVSAQGYPVTVGGGGASGGGSNSNPIKGAPGVNSTALGITSTGGGTGGGGNPSPYAADPGGSGGGVGSGVPGAPKTEGSGNTPPVSPPQGNPGGVASSPQFVRSGGGGATTAGGIGYCGRPACFSSIGGAGGGTGINPAPGVGTPGPSAPLRYFAGGGAGIDGDASIDAAPTGGSSPNAPYQVGGGAVGGGNGTTNTGGGGSGDNGNGGSGIVMIRYKFQ
jgi:hypothetical protein